MALGEIREELSTQPMSAAEEEQVAIRNIIWRKIGKVPDFPKAGIMFYDVLPILRSPDAFHHTINWMAGQARLAGASCIVAPEARGFLFGVPVAAALNLPFVPVRKTGKLPGAVVSVEYSTEYGGTEKLCIQEGSIPDCASIFIVDDILATGGTVEAILKLLAAANPTVRGAGSAFVLELSALKAKERLGWTTVRSIISL